MNPLPATDSATAVIPLDLVRRHDWDGLTQFLRRAAPGDATTRPGVPQLLRDRQQGPYWRQQYGDLAARGIQPFLSWYAAEQLLIQEAVRDQLAALRTELAGATATALERILVCWVQVHCGDALAARSVGADEAGTARSERSQSRAQARLLEALKGLAVLRQLQRSAPSPLELAARPVPESPVPARVHRRGRAGEPGAAGAN